RRTRQKAISRLSTQLRTRRPARRARLYSFARSIVIAFSIPPLTLEIAEGDIAAEATEVIVNAANNAFWMGAGVAGAIKRRGGPKTEAEAMAQGRVEPGGCVITWAASRAARHVIPAAVMGQDLQTSSDLIARATRQALRMADKHRLESIALPAFGTGVGGFPVAQCARLMIDAIPAHAPAATWLPLVRLVLFGRSAYEAFAEVAGEILGESRRK